MFEGYLFTCAQKRKALNYALTAFDESAYRLVVSQLEDRYKLIIEGSPCSAVADIEAALRDMAGSSADLIISRMHAYLRSLQLEPAKESQTKH
jgi:hypothetical protein